MEESAHDLAHEINVQQMHSIMFVIIKRLYVLIEINWINQGKMSYLLFFKSLKKFMKDTMSLLLQWHYFLLQIKKIHNRSRYCEWRCPIYTYLVSSRFILFDIGWWTWPNNLPPIIRLQQENSSWLWHPCWGCWSGSARTLHHRSQGTVPSVGIRISGLWSFGTHKSIAS
jgi:hypothetical protein